MKSFSNSKQTDIEQIYRDNRDHVYNYIYRLSNDHDQAQDVSQQTFVKIIGDPGLDKVTNIKAYLFTIARNHLYDTWKKKKETLLPDDEIAMAEDFDATNVTDEIAQEQLQQAVESCVQRLTDKYRELMVLRYVEDLSIKEITAVTEYSESDVKVSLLRARQQFDQGLTQHMYLKIAKSRQQCTEIDGLLAPYVDRDIPDNELAPFEKHITQCQICAEDAEEMKRTRKLMALIPLAGAPLSLDTSFNDALASTSTEASNTPGNIMTTKVAASVAAVALIVGGVLLLTNKDSDTSPVVPTQVTQQQKKTPTKAAKPVAQPAKPTSPTGTVPFTATARLTASSPPVEVNWQIYQVNKANKKQEKTLGGKRGPIFNKKLEPGQYRITARAGDAEVERIIQAVSGKPISLEIVINAGKANISTNLPKIVQGRHSQLSYLIYKSRQDLEKRKLLAVKSFSLPASTFTLPAGDYFLKASFRGFGDIEAVQSFRVQAGKTIEIEAPIAIGIFKPEVILSNKNLPYIGNVWWSARKPSAPQTTPGSNYNNGKETSMAPGTYILTTKLDNIIQESKITIKNRQVTPHKLILRGGIVKSAAWLDSSKTKRNNNIYSLQIYDFEKYKLHSKPGAYVPTIAAIRNNMPNATAILPEGKYTLVAKNARDHKVRATRHFTVKDGDTQFIELVIPKKGE